MADIVRNGDLTLKQRIDLIKRCLMIGNVHLRNERQLDNSFYCFDIKINQKDFKLYLLLKNIVNSGWNDKPFIKRIQVKAFTMSDIEKNTTDGCSIFIGIAYANEIPIFVAWNPFMFLYHNTVRSCYIDVELLARCQHEGLIKTVSSKQKVILADPNHFCDLINLYLEENTIRQL